MLVCFFMFLAEGVLQIWEINPGLVITVCVCDADAAPAGELY